MNKNKWKRTIIISIKWKRNLREKKITRESDEANEWKKNRKKLKTRKKGINCEKILRRFQSNIPIFYVYSKFCGYSEETYRRLKQIIKANTQGGVSFVGCHKESSQSVKTEEKKTSVGVVKENYLIYRIFYS